MDPAPNGSRVLIRVTIAGVLLAALTTAATFTNFAREFTFLRYPLLGASMLALVMAGWTSGRLPAFNRALWAHAPWWARLSWLAIIFAIMGIFTTISLIDHAPTVSVPYRVLETRGIGAVAAYFFLIAGLRRNVDLSNAKLEPIDDYRAADRTGRNRKVVG